MESNKDNKKNQIENYKGNSFLLEFFLILFKPSNYVDDLNEIDFSFLKEQGTKLIVCDLDNTLVPHFTKFPTLYAKKVIASIKDSGIDLVIISNNIEKRVSHFANIADVEYISNAKKPFTKKIKSKIDEKGYKKNEVLIIGDMIIMDIIAANRLGYESILVRPILSYNSEVSNMTRWFEKNIFKRLQRNNLLINENSDYLAIYDKKYEII